ncbi:MAG TPA: hypothetical protein V6C99_09240 [Oculatellaceae cyanobacterium]|jgi:hypothetical protein
MDANTDNLSDLEKEVQAVVDIVKPGGLVAGAVMAGSTGSYIGKCLLPGVPLNEETLKKAFEKAGVRIIVSRLKTPPQLREGYDGILVYYGIKPEKEAA